MSLAVTSRNLKALLTTIKTAFINETIPAWTIVIPHFAGVVTRKFFSKLFRKMLVKNQQRRKERC